MHLPVEFVTCHIPIIAIVNRYICPGYLLHLLGFPFAFLLLFHSSFPAYLHGSGLLLLQCASLAFNRLKAGFHINRIVLKAAGRCAWACSIPKGLLGLLLEPCRSLICQAQQPKELSLRTVLLSMRRPQWHLLCTTHFCMVNPLHALLAARRLCKPHVNELLDITPKWNHRLSSIDHASRVGSAKQRSWLGQLCLWMPAWLVWCSFNTSQCMLQGTAIRFFAGFVRLCSGDLMLSDAVRAEQLACQRDRAVPCT